MTGSRLALQLTLCGGLALGLGEHLTVPPLSLYGLGLLGVGMVGLGWGWAARRYGKRG